MFMKSFFESPIKNRAFNQKILVLISCSPNRFSRYYYNTLTSTALSIQPESIRNTALKRYGLSHLNLTWPKAVDSAKEVNYIEKNPKSIRKMYGESDLSKLPIFQGGFINFGYWPDPFFDTGEITVKQRIASSKEMYRVVGDLAGILKEHSLLDVGCGLGYGSSFLSNYYGPKLVVGVDISPDQIIRAEEHQKSSKKLRFTLGKAERMPFVDNSFDCVISVEAAQHFLSMGAFSEEISRVLKPGGKLVITSFFPTTKEGVSALNAIVPNYHIHGSQNTIKDVEKKLTKCLENVKVNSIGKNVWYGFSKWLDQIGYQNQWSKIWCALYEKGLIDYMVYQAQAPKAIASQQPDANFLNRSNHFNDSA